MSAEEALEDWLVDKWVELAERKAQENSLGPVDDLLDRFCFVDYCMRNAGDLANLKDPPGVSAFLGTAALDAGFLGLRSTQALFSLSRGELESEYFARFVAVCSELKQACSADD